MTDVLYAIFHEHLTTPSITDDFSTEKFAENVVIEYLNRLVAAGHIITESAREEIKLDLKEEVLNMARKKTYGHFSIKDYRKFNNIK